MIDQEIVVQNQAKTYTRSVDSKGRGYGTGRGKRDAVAKVWASYSSAGNKIKINNKTADEYFSNPSLTYILTKTLADILGDEVFVDVMISTHGGGKSGQARAAKLGLARALTVLNPALHESLRKGGYLTRDARVAEPMKPGQPGARKKYPYNRR